ncbi:hypothetical protein [Rhodopila sp.]|uniref:hypothetical protein n=1 Tax=Rhodopila sp. TaxID=2480087 RepID=UPI003D0F5B03
MARRFATKRTTAPRPPKRSEILDVMDRVETALLSIVRRWQDSVAPELRDEINVAAREPLLQMLLRAGRRPRPRGVAGSEP